MTQKLSTEQQQQLRNALIWLKPYVRFGYLAKQCGFLQNYFTYAISGKKGGGADFVMPVKCVDSLRDALQKLSVELFIVKIKDGESSSTEQPLCYGENALAQFKQLNGVLRMENVNAEFGEITKHQLHVLVADTSYCRYGRFTQDELTKLNTAIRRLALQINTLQLPEVGTAM